MIEFFIKRPIFAAVVALLMLLSGGVSILFLPIAQFPQITPPTVQVTSTYPGASAKTTSDVVTRPLEQAINGVQGMIYMSSVSTNNGSSVITVTFDVGYDLDIAAVDVQNNSASSIPQLPTEVQRQGVTVAKQSTDLLMVVALVSPNKTYDDIFLSNYADINVTQPLKRVPGVGSVTNFGLRQYSIRIWLDTAKLAALNLSPDVVQAAVSQQNQQAVGGQTAAAPTAGMQAYTMQVNTLGRLTTVEQFEEIVVRTKDQGGLVNLKDVARVELGAASYSSVGKQNGVGAALLGIYQLPDANAYAVAEGVRQTMDRLAPGFPSDVEQQINFDTTRFVSASINEVMTTFYEAVVLVLLVIFVFLQSFRTTLIPMIAIPVSIVGTFAILLALGFSINQLTLLGLVLAIGLVVDDAIVVVENVERQFEEGATDPHKATARAMREVAAPIIATTLCLAAVFVPAALMPGITGQLYNQFALTIAISVILSGINSLTLSPALCALLLRPSKHDRNRGFWGSFNRNFTRVEHAFEASVGWLERRWWIVAGAFVVLIGLTGALLLVTPTAFIPDEDNGYFFVAYQLPPGSTLDRSVEVGNQVREIIAKQPEIENIIEITGVNFLTGASQTNSGFIIPVLVQWEARPGVDHTTPAVVERVSGPLYMLPTANVFAFNPPAIPGLGTVGGFQLQVNDQGGLGIDALTKATDQLLAAANGPGKPPAIGFASTTFQKDVPQVWLDIDRVKIESLGIGIGSAFSALQLNFGSFFVNQFNLFGQVYQVYIQADAAYRMTPEDLGRIYVQNNKGKMVPFAAFSSLRQTTGPDNLPHYNVMDSIPINGNSAPGYSSGQSVQAMEALCKEVLPQGITYEWTGIIYQQMKAGNVAPFVFGLAIIAVFLFLSAVYESWTLPLLVIITVPLAALGALATLRLAGRPLDVYAQIGLVMLIGLAAKNAILIIEFAKEAREKGATAIEAARTAARLRLRPILMTALSFILGVIPLALATGAGANSRVSIGLTVIGGLSVATFFTLIIVPVFYVVLENIREKVFKIDVVAARRRLDEQL
ncbi:MAG: multidrug efflux RND transporter permease subunit [Phycisphaerae bacterium]|nr:multidrug efflux RND transporter permease subunit [Phycisphaerae bacterium]